MLIIKSGSSLGRTSLVCSTHGAGGACGEKKAS